MVRVEQNQRTLAQQA